MKNRADVSSTATSTGMYDSVQPSASRRRNALLRVVMQLLAVNRDLDPLTVA